MAYEDCLAAVRKAAKGKLSDDDIADLAEELHDRLRKKAKGLKSEEELISETIQELNQADARAAFLEKRQRAINLLRKEQRFNAYGQQAPGKEGLALSALNVGSERGFIGAGRSVDAQAHALAGELTGPLLNELRKDGVLDLLKQAGPEFERDVANEMWRLAGGIARDTGNEVAKKAGAIFAKYQEAARNMQNQAGAFIGKLPGWIVRQSHDQLRIARAGLAEWRRIIEPRLASETFEGIENRDDFFRGLFVNLASGNHIKSSGASDDWLAGFKGPANLAKKASAQRSLHFKSADAWFEYNEKFGSQSLLDGIVSGLRNAGRNTALMRVWGTNPRAAFQRDVEELILKAKDRGDLKAIKELNGARIRAQFDEIEGSGDIPVNPALAAWGRGIRAVQSMAKLGGQLLSQFPDLAVRASTLRHNGINFLEGVQDGFASILRGRGTDEQKEIAELTGVGIEGTLGGIHGRAWNGDGGFGKISKLMDTFFRLNGATYWTDAQSTGIGLMLSRHLALNQEKAFADLHSSLQISLGRYGIQKEHWRILQRTETKLAEGENYLTPEAVRDVPDEHFDALLSKPSRKPKILAYQRAEARRDLETSLRTYYVDQVAEAMTAPGARERALVLQGTKGGTAIGEALRFVTQFKLYPVTYVSRHLGREILRNGEVDKTGLAQLIVSTTALGYLSMVAKDIVKGRQPRDPRDAATWGAAFKQGGGAGIYGDFLFGEYNRLGGGLVETLAGPTAGSVGEIARVWAASIRGEDARALGLRALVNNTPFANLFYTRQALDYLVLYQMQEALNPGFLQRMERRIKNDNNQRFYLQPSSVIARGGGFR